MNLQSYFRAFVRTVPFIAALCAGVVAAPPTRAALIEYDFSSNATMTLAGAIFSISGSCDCDTTTSSISAPNVTLKYQSNTEAFTTLDTTHAPGCVNTATMICLNTPSGDFFGQVFAQSLA